MSHLHTRGFPGIQISLHRATSSNLSNLKILFSDRENGKVWEFDVQPSSSSSSSSSSPLLLSPSSSFIIICSHYTIWTKSWDCPYSSICSNSYAFFFNMLFKRAFFFNCPWLFYSFYYLIQTSFHSGLQHSWYNSCGGSSLIYILPWLRTHLSF